LKRLAIGRSFERAIAYTNGYVSSLIMFILASTVNNDLTFAIIFSTLEMIASLKINTTQFVSGVGLYYEIKVVFTRFASIFNVQIKSMIEID
jgi:hypothetical protein